MKIIGASCHNKSDQSTRKKRCCLAGEEGVSSCEVNKADPKKALTRIVSEQEACRESQSVLHHPQG